MNTEKHNWKAMIPLYLNGQLSGDLEKAFESQLDQDKELGRELQEFDDIKKSYSGMVSCLSDPPEHAFEKIMDSINRQDEKVTAKSPLFSIHALVRKCRGAYESFHLAWAVASVQMAIIIVLVFTQIPDRGFKTLNGPDKASLSANGTMINVVFDDRATEGEIRALLTLSGAIIIGGPLENGLYILKIDEGKTVDTVLEHLKNAPQVRLAQKRF
ncbi:MAG: hypothetical protein V1793_12945 [Pseudomonadota bacterium]